MLLALSPGVLLPGLVHSADVQWKQGLGPTLQHPGSWWKERAGQVDPPQKQRGLRGVQGQPQVVGRRPLQPAAGKLPLQ